MMIAKTSSVLLAVGTLCSASATPKKIFADPAEGVVSGVASGAGQVAADLGAMDLVQLENLALQGDDDRVRVYRWLAEQEPAAAGTGPILTPGDYSVVFLMHPAANVTSAVSVPRVLHENVAKLPVTQTKFAVAIRDAVGLEKIALIPELTWQDEYSFNCSVTVYDRGDKSVTRIRALTVRGEQKGPRNRQAGAGWLVVSQELAHLESLKDLKAFMDSSTGNRGLVYSALQIVGTYYDVHLPEEGNYPFLLFLKEGSKINSFHEALQHLLPGLKTRKPTALVVGFRDKDGQETLAMFSELQWYDDGSGFDTGGVYFPWTGFPRSPEDNLPTAKKVRAFTIRE